MLKQILVLTLAITFTSTAFAGIDSEFKQPTELNIVELPDTVQMQGAGTGSKQPPRRK